MWYLYIDESGDMGDYPNKNVYLNNKSSKYFTLGGIVVDENTKIDFETKTKALIEKHFGAMELPRNFKLHYHPLRQNVYPYNHLSDEDRWSIPDSIFKCIRESDCKLLAVTLDLEEHCKRYERPPHPMAYTLLVMMDRFHHLLKDVDDSGTVIYEKYNSSLRKKVEGQLKWLMNDPRLSSLSIYNIKGNVRNGDPKEHPILQMSDFFAYLPWNYYTTNRNASDRLSSLTGNFYNLGGDWSKAGFVKI